MLTTKRRIATVGVLAAAVVAVLGSSAQAQTLRWKFKAGDKVQYTSESKMHMTMNINGMEIEQDMDQMVDTTWNIKEVGDDGVAALNVTNDRVRMKMESAFGAFDYDSKAGQVPEGPIGMVLGPVLEALVGAEIACKVDGQGKVSEAKLPEKFIEAVQGNPALAQFGGMFTEDGYKAQLEQAILPLPDGAVSKGKKWDRKLSATVPMIGKISIKGDYSYDGTETRGGVEVAKIGVKTEQTFEPAPDAVIELKVKSQESEGTAYFDVKTGRMTESETKQKIVMEISTMGMAFEQTVDVTQTTKLGKGADDTKEEKAEKKSEAKPEKKDDAKPEKKPDAKPQKKDDKKSK